MAKFNSRYSKFTLTDSGGTARDLSAYITGVDGLPGRRNLSDVTALGDAGIKHAVALEDVQITLDILFDDTATSGPDVVLGKLQKYTAATAFAYGPKGSSAAALKYSGTCWVQEYTLTSRVGDMVKARAVLAVEGTVTRGTFT